MQSDYMDQDHHDYHQYSNHTGGYGDSSSEQLYLGESSHYSEEEGRPPTNDHLFDLNPFN